MQRLHGQAEVASTQVSLIEITRAEAVDAPDNRFCDMTHTMAGTISVLLWSP